MAEGYYGQLTDTDANDEFNSHTFHIRQQIAKVRTGIPVKVVAVNGGGVAAPPTIDVQPLVTQIDSQGNATSHGVIHGIPVARTQGGASAIISDPVVGDVGYMVIADRDISSLKANAGAQSNPGSFRRHNLSDGVYVGAILNATAPSQYVQFVSGGGVKVVDSLGNSIVTGSSGVTITDKFGNVVSMASGKVAVSPGGGGIVYLGGDGSTGSYSPVTTTAGPSTTVQARYA